MNSRKQQHTKFRRQINAERHREHPKPFARPIKNHHHLPTTPPASGRAFNKLTLAQQLLFILALLHYLRAALGKTPLNKQATTKPPTQHRTTRHNSSISNSANTIANQTTMMAHTFFHQHTEVTTYRTLPVTKLAPNATQDCTAKIVGGNAGKICLIEGRKYVLKVIPYNNNQPAAIKKLEDQTTTNTLLAEYNIKLMRSIGIQCPTTKLFFEKNGVFISSSGKEISAELYHASAVIENFVTFEVFSQQIREKLKLSERNTIFAHLSLNEIIAHRLTSKIHTQGIAQLAVASTLVDDLITNSANWGIMADRLVLIDVDNAPRTYNDFHTTATNMPIFFKTSGIYFTKQTLTEMIAIYRDMLANGAPKLHRDVDINDEMYQSLIKTYIKSCQQALFVIATRLSPANPEKPNAEINLELERQLRIHMAAFQNKRSPN